ncbi:hypothetical protein OAO18_03265 [Francisellaceae bacterium]|nr:hypothetical protein [Francisellaceae bacterium]
MKIRKSAILIGATIASLISTIPVNADMTKRDDSMQSIGAYLQNTYTTALGGAINIFSLKPLNIDSENECYVIANPTQAITFEKNSNVNYGGKVKTEVYSTAAAYSSSLGVSASLSVGYGLFTASASFSSNTSTAQSSNGVVASWISNASTTKILDIHNLTLTEKGKTKVKALNDAFEESYSIGDVLTPTQSEAMNSFINSCGAAIASSIELGNTARMDVNIITSSTSAKSTITGEFTAGVGALDSLTASMKSESENKTSSFGLQASAYAQPSSKLEVKPSSLGGCGWDSDSNTWNASCIQAQKEFDNTSAKIQSAPETGAVVIKFPEVTMANQLNVLSENASDAMGLELKRMKREYETLSDDWLDIKHQLDTLKTYLSRSSFPPESAIGQELTPEKVNEFKDKFDMFSTVLENITRDGYISPKTLKEANAAKESIEFPPLTASLLNSFVNDPSNEKIYQAVEYDMTVDGNHAPNNYMTVLVDHEKYSEVVLGGKLIYNGQEDGHSTYYYCSAYYSPYCKFNTTAVDYLYNISFQQGFCTYDLKPAELYGYAITVDNKVLPIVVHSLRKTIKENKHPAPADLCFAYIDQNFNTIPASSFDAVEDAKLGSYDSVIMRYTQETPVTNYYWSWLSDGAYLYPDRHRGFLTFGNAERGYHLGIDGRDTNNRVALP